MVIYFHFRDPNQNRKKLKHKSKKKLKVYLNHLLEKAEEERKIKME